MKIFIETLGCPKNFNDSEYAYGSFFSAGFKKADSISDADVVVVNTCGFIYDAKVESIDAIFDAAQKKVFGNTRCQRMFIAKVYGRA